MQLEAVTLFHFHRYKSRAENPPRTRRDRVAITRDISYLPVASGIHSFPPNGPTAVGSHLPPLNAKSIAKIVVFLFIIIQIRRGKL